MMSYSFSLSLFVSVAMFAQVRRYSVGVRRCSAGLGIDPRHLEQSGLSHCPHFKCL